MAVQCLVLIHPREFEIPTIKDIDPIAKTQDDEVQNIIEEDDISNDKALQEDEPQDI